MDIKNIACIVGTRPEAIKMAPVIKRFSHSEEFQCKVIATGQHTDMLYQALSYFKIKPDVDLKLMKERQTLSYLTSSILEGVGNLLDRERPDMVLVHGDTATTFASALSAFYRKIPVGHVEAGLRSGDPYLPFPEEINRIMTDDLSTLFFAPTPKAGENLIKEGKDPASIFITGNTVIDSLLWTLGNNSSQIPECVSTIPESCKIILVTVHRRESWGKPLVSICGALKDLLNRYDDLYMVIPMHMNPEIRRIMREKLYGLDRIILCDPLPYPDFIKIMQMSHLILSDSGGVQEEASALKKPLLILRDKSERPEAITEGSGILVGTNRDNIINESLRLIDDGKYYMRITGRVGNPFGDGRAAERIERIIRSFFENVVRPIS